MTMDKDKTNFEESLARLEKIVGEMESGNLPLGEILDRFEEGRKLVQACTAELEAVRRRIEKVTATEPPKIEPLDIMDETPKTPGRTL